MSDGKWGYYFRMKPVPYVLTWLGIASGAMLGAVGLGLLLRGTP